MNLVPGFLLIMAPVSKQAYYVLGFKETGVFVNLNEFCLSFSGFNGSIWRIDVGMSSGVLDSRPEVEQ